MLVGLQRLIGGQPTSPIYHAHKKGIPVHVWVDETRPRNQGASI